MSVGKIDDLVSEAALDRLDVLLTKLGITRDAMASATEQAAKFTAALGDTRSLQEFAAAQEKSSQATQNVIAANNTILTQQKEIAVQTQATADAVRAKVAADASADVVLKQVGGSLDANIKQLIQQKLELKAVNDQLKDLSKQYAGSTQSQTALANKTASLTKEQIQLKEAIASQNLIIKQQAKELNSTATSQDAQLARLNLLRKAYNTLSTEEQNNIKVGGVLQAQIVELAAVTSAANEKQGKFNDNVGNYESSFSKAGKAVGGFLTPIRQLAYILPGIGMAGIFNLAFEGLSALLTNFDLFKEKVSQVKENLKNFNDIQKDASKEYGTQTTKLEILYKAAIDVNNSQKNRLDAAKALQATFPETFGDISKENILNGESAKAYDLTTEAIIRNAQAKAASTKIAELAAKIFETDIQNQKIEIANNNERVKMEQDAFDKTIDAFKFEQKRKGLSTELTNEQIRNLKKVSDASVVYGKYESDVEAQKAKDKQAILKQSLKDQIDLIKKVAGGNNVIADAIDGSEKNKPLDNAKELNNDELELQKAKLQGEKETAKLILDDNQQSYETRLAALKIYVERSKAIIGTENTIADHAPGISGIKKQTNAQNAKNQIGQVDNFELNEQQKIQKEIAANAKSAREKMFKDLEAFEKQQEDLVTNSSNERLLELDFENAQTILKLTDKYKQGLISEKNYNAEVTRLRKAAAIEGIDIQIAALEKIRDAQIVAATFGFGSSKDVQATKNKIKGLKTQSTNLKIDNVVAGAKGGVGDEKEKAKEMIAFSEQAIKGLEIVQGLIASNAQAKIDALEKEFALIQQNGEAEKTRIGNSILSSKEKAREQNIVDAQVAQQHARIIQQENEVKKRQAEFDKAAAIAKIIQQTAVAVVSALTIPIYGEVLAGVIGALGAAQLAVAIATPLPQFYKGTKNAPEGLAHVGERGTELQINPDGSMGLTPNTDTITYLKKGTQIIPNHELVAMLGKPDAVTYVGGTYVDNKRLEKLMQQNNELQKKRPAPVVKIYGDKWGAYSQQRNY